MNKKVLTYTIIFAIITNLVASLLFADSDIRRYSDPQNVSAALGFWFLAASLIAWFIAGIIYTFRKRANK